MKIISDQVTQTEINVIMRCLEAVLKSGINGDVVELGCYIGTTSLFISDLLKSTDSKKSFHVYDSFAGLPDKMSQDQSPAGEQFKQGELLATKAQLIKNYKQAHLPIPIIHKAWFEELGPIDLPEQICLAFLDGDYYSSIKSSLKLIWPRLNKGAIVIVDDYANEALPGAAWAVDEWLKQHRAKLRVEASLAIIYPEI